jgi:uncharacterized protein (TIGR02145 family)
MCPSPWKVPAKDDFVALDICLKGGGSGSNRSETGEWVTANYINKWGGSYGGYADGRSMDSVGSSSNYWSATENGSNAYHLGFNSGGLIYPQNYNGRYHGFQVRCVK